jgi:hypothetical protein
MLLDSEEEVLRGKALEAFTEWGKGRTYRN